MLDVSNLPSRNFHPRIYGVGAWTNHLFFAFDLVAFERPKLLVELGTDRGESYFAFCQSAAENRTGTRCVAVDTWKGDAHSGSYDEVTFRDVDKHNRAHYEEFSTLQRQTFDEARAEFGEGTIDLLHLDGFHSEEAVRHDLANWLPKLAAGGLLLLHDVNVRDPGFGVWKIWDELKKEGRAFAFDDGPGLGLWEKPPECASAFRDVWFGADRTSSTRMIDYYRARVRQLQEQIALEWQSGAIRHGAQAHETVIQVFFSSDGSHREADSVGARIGHDGWKDVLLELPPHAGTLPLRIDFVSALHIIEIDRIRVARPGRVYYEAATPSDFAQIEVRGDAQKLPDPVLLRLKVTGIDPQLYLPPLPAAEGRGPLTVEIRLRVCEELSSLPD